MRFRYIARPQRGQLSLNRVIHEVRRLTALGGMLFAWSLASFVMLTPGDVQAQSDWIDVFADNEFSHWQRLDNRGGLEAIQKNWRVTEDGWLHLYNPAGGGSSLMLKEEIGDFELSFFWKIKQNANNGVKFRVRKYGNRTLGIEYQLLDDDVKNGNTAPKHRTGSIYDLFVPSEDKPLNPPGSLNHSRIRVRNNQVEHWLNGVEVASVDIGSDRWKEAVSKSKFAPHEGFGENETGRIMFTDHGGEIWFRDVLMRTFD
ncbi:MAG: DUF1080 domain-containing protein [Planctomycetota bacterium]